MKKNNIIQILLASFFCCFALSSCYEDYTKFYEDQQEPGLSIFSDKAFNIMTCYTNLGVWRTDDRTFGGLYSTTNYEVYIGKVVSRGIMDTLIIDWEGNFLNNVSTSLYRIGLILPIPKNFTYKDFNNLQGKRISLDGTNGYFTNTSFSPLGDVIGTGNIFFHFAELDSSGVNYYHGRMSGLFDAQLGSIKITNGRFDHAIDPAQVNF